MIDALLENLSDDFIQCSDLPGNSLHIEESGQRLRLIGLIQEQYAALADKHADERFNASIQHAMSWEGNQ